MKWLKVARLYVSVSQGLTKARSDKVMWEEGDQHGEIRSTQIAVAQAKIETLWKIELELSNLISAGDDGDD